MVTYQQWTAIAFDVARQRGLRTAGPGGQQALSGGRRFTGDEPQNRTMGLVASLWRTHEETIRDATHPEARAIAGDLIEQAPAAGP